MTSACSRWSQPPKTAISNWNGSTREVYATAVDPRVGHYGYRQSWGSLQCFQESPQGSTPLQNPSATNDLEVQGPNLTKAHLEAEVIWMRQSGVTPQGFYALATWEELTRRTIYQTAPPRRRGTGVKVVDGSHGRVYHR